MEDEVIRHLRSIAFTSIVRQLANDEKIPLHPRRIVVPAVVCVPTAAAAAEAVAVAAVLPQPLWTELRASNLTAKWLRKAIRLPWTRCAVDVRVVGLVFYVDWENLSLLSPSALKAAHCVFSRRAR